jgi:hypothetical protein
MPEQEFIIRALLEFEYRVTAGTADEAELIMDDGGLKDKGECVGYSVDAVVSADKRGDFWRDEDDLRARCECGHLVVNEHTGRKFGEREPSETFTQQCSAFRCDCLAPVEAAATS